MTSALFFPFLVWGGFVFLPFDAPMLDSAPLRLVYTLRCSVFAAAPIILGKNYTDSLTCLCLTCLTVCLSPVCLTCLSLRLAGSGCQSAEVRCDSASV